MNIELKKIQDIVVGDEVFIDFHSDVDVNGFRKITNIKTQVNSGPYHSREKRNYYSLEYENKPKAMDGYSFFHWYWENQVFPVKKKRNR